MSSGNIFPAALPPHTVGPYAVQNAKTLKKVSLLIITLLTSERSGAVIHVIRVERALTGSNALF